MTIFVFANNYIGSVASGVASSDLVIDVLSVAGLPTIPAGDYLALTLIRPTVPGMFEVVYVTAISGNVLTVLRAQEGSTTQVWENGDTIFSGPTAGILSNFVQISQAFAGVGASYHNFSTTKTVATTYTNTQNRPVFLSVFGVVSAETTININVNGITIAASSEALAGVYGGVVAIIPVGASYSVTVGTATLSGMVWFEFY